MNTSVTETAAATATAELKNTKARSRSKKVRALLAGGLVLGLGATVTLAAWNDSEFATGTFTAGAFNLEGSTDNTTFASHETAAPANLAFTLAPDNLAPDTEVYAPFAVRLDSSTTSAADVAITVESTSGDVSNLTYALLETSAFGCDADTTGTSLVTAGTAMTAVAGTSAFHLDIGTPAGPDGDPAATAGDPVYLCFVVSAGAIEQNQTGTVTWEFAATSIS